MLIKRTLKEGELSECQKIYETVRKDLNISPEKFYGNEMTAKEYVFQHGNVGLTYSPE